MNREREHRDAATGQYTTAADAAARPAERYREAVADAVAKWDTPEVGPAMDIVEYETRTTDAYRQTAQRWRERCEKAEAERDALLARVEATPKTPLPALGDTSGTPSMIGGRVRRILGDRPAPMPPIERVCWYRELARMLSVAADKWERAEEAARADQ